MIKGSIPQEDVIIKENIPIRSFKIPEAKTDRTENRNKSIITVGDLNAPLSIIDRASAKKVSKDM